MSNNQAAKCSHGVEAGEYCGTCLLKSYEADRLAMESIDAELAMEPDDAPAPEAVPAQCVDASAQNLATRIHAYVTSCIGSRLQVETARIYAMIATEFTPAEPSERHELNETDQARCDLATILNLPEATWPEIVAAADALRENLRQVLLRISDANQWPRSLGAPNAEQWLMRLHKEFGQPREAPIHGRSPRYDRELSAQFHKVWTSQVGTEGYDKDQWQKLRTLLLQRGIEV